MTTPEDYEFVANWVYKVDPLWPGRQARVNDEFFTGNDKSKQKWKVIDVAANESNGFQGMAVVPFVNDKPDKSHVFVAFAGTNFADTDDIFSDVIDVGLGNKDAGTQTADAMKFMEKVRGKYSDATFETVGHSLGGFLALYVAAEKRLRATAFNAPDASDALSPEAKEWVKQNQAGADKPLRNFVNELDTVGNLKPDGMNARIPVADQPGRDFLDYHNLGTGNAYTFDAQGEIIGAGVGSVDYGVILYNLGQAGPAQAYWAAEGNSRYGKVLVAMEPAIALANTIGALAEELRTIKSANNAVEEEMEAQLLSAKNLYMVLHGSVTGTDIESCVATHRLDVHENLDRHKVAEVNTLVNRHLTLVSALHDGIHNTLVNALVQDGQAAAGFTGQHPRR